MLVAGVYMPTLPMTVSQAVARRGEPFVDQVARIVRQEMEARWRILEQREPPERVRQARAFAFVVGFDASESPRLFYIDNKSNPPFVLQERRLFGAGNNLEVGAMSTGSGELDDVSGMLGAEIGARLTAQITLDRLLTESFDQVKDRLAERYESIGGTTFSLVIRQQRTVQSR